MKKNRNNNNLNLEIKKNHLVGVCGGLDQVKQLF